MKRLDGTCVPPDFICPDRGPAEGICKFGPGCFPDGCAGGRSLPVHAKLR